MARLRRGGIKQVQRQSMTMRKLAFVFSFAALAGAALFVLNNLGTSEETLANPGKDGSKTITTSNTIVNEYTTLTSNASSGSTTLNVAASTLNANGRFSGSLAAGDLVLIIQMQGASISTNNNSSYGTVSSYNSAGMYEFARVSARPNSTSITLSTGLRNSYNNSGKTQVIRVPRYTTLTINNGSSITCPDWNGSSGGVVAVEATQTVTINGSINANGKGFRGGVVEQNTTTPGTPSTYRTTSNSEGAEKGESIAGPASILGNGAFGRGAPANGGGGGNAHNGGGGGGSNAGSGTWTGNGNPDNSNANWTTAWNLESVGFSSTTSPGGGRGGYSWSSNGRNPITTAPGNAGWGGDNRQNSGGFGGRNLDNASTTRVFLGGGGGAGDSNNNTGTSGADGGGIVFVVAKGNIGGTGSVTANGDTPPNTSSCTTCYGDAAGGGGGGGSVVMHSLTGSLSTISISANGGNGGSQNIITTTGECESPGGGGGGGYIATSPRTGVTVTVNGGNNGHTDSPPMVNFTPNGATRGALGTTVVLPSNFNPYNTTNNTLPVTLVSFLIKSEDGAAAAEWATAAEKNNDYFLLERSSDGDNFEVVGRIAGSGTTTIPRKYIFTDPAPFPGTSYYRLKQVDYDGQSETFKTIPFDNNQKIGDLKIVEVSPNPFTNELRLIADIPEAGVISVEILSMGGAKVWETQSDVQDGRQIMHLQPEIKTPGVYLLRISDTAGKSTVMKVVKR